jgi:hypothetical protein
MCAASPAVADKTFAVTPSGAAEMVFPQKPQDVVGKLSSKCIDVHWTVTSSSSNELVCEAPLNAGQSILGQLAMGNSYSTPPRRYFRFNVAEIAGISRVQASGWLELQMAFGQTRRTDITGPQFQNNIMSFMATAGGKYPLGTTFPNHAALGVNVEDFQQGKYDVFRIKEVLPGSAAEKAGLRVGDVVSRIAGKPFKTLDDYFDATGKAAETPTYAVDFTRDSKPMTVTVERVFRPAWAEAVTSIADPAQAAPTPAPTSVADELLKLKKLEDAGVITQAEFEAQKAKLLGEHQ